MPFGAFFGLATPVGADEALASVELEKNDADQKTKTFYLRIIGRLSWRKNPLRATSAGIHDWNDLLPSVGPEDYARRLSERKKFLDELHAIDRSRASEPMALNAEIFEFILSNQVELGAYKSWRIPFLADSGFHSNIVTTMKQAPLRSARNYEDYIARLDGLPKLISTSTLRICVLVCQMDLFSLKR